MASPGRLVHWRVRGQRSAAGYLHRLSGRPTFLVMPSLLGGSGSLVRLASLCAQQSSIRELTYSTGLWQQRIGGTSNRH